MEEFEKIICPVSFSEISKASVEMAMQIASISKGKIALVHIIQDPWSDLYYPDGDASRRSPTKAEKRAKEMLEEFAKEWKKETVFDFYVECAQIDGPVKKIAKFARFYDADLIVLHVDDALGKSSAENLTSNLIRWAHCSVLSLQSPEMAMDNILDDKLVLLVDDEPDVLDTLRDILSMCRIHTAASYNSALKCLEENKYDIVVLDIMGVNGFDLLRKCVQLGLPAVMLTAHAITAEAIKKSMKLGAVFFLPKIKMMALPDFMKEIVLGGGKPIWSSFFERLDFFFEKRLSKDWEGLKRISHDLEKEIL
jgi:CheY-like chemotaxis protein